MKFVICIAIAFSSIFALADDRLFQMSGQLFLNRDGVFEVVEVVGPEERQRVLKIDFKYLDQRLPPQLRDWLLQTIEQGITTQSIPVLKNLRGVFAVDHFVVEVDQRSRAARRNWIPLDVKNEADRDTLELMKINYDKFKKRLGSCHGAI